MLKILRKSKNKELLVITPLLKTDTISHSISKKTKETIKNNNIDFIWVSFEGPYKHATNVQNGIEQFKKQFGFLPKYIQILDRDIILSKNMLDKLHDTIKKASINDYRYAFSFCPFEYKGYINIKFPPKEYNINILLNNNYISSNSMYVTDAIEKVGGFVTDERVHRTSDWAMFLKLYKYGFIGKLCENTSFVAVSTKNDISAGSNDEFIKTRKLIYENYILPMGLSFKEN